SAGAVNAVRAEGRTRYCRVWRVQGITAWDKGMSQLASGSPYTLQSFGFLGTVCLWNPHRLNSHPHKRAYSNRSRVRRVERYPRCWTKRWRDCWNTCTIVPAMVRPTGGTSNHPPHRHKTHASLFGNASRKPVTWFLKKNSTASRPISLRRSITTFTAHRNGRHAAVLC